LQIAQEYEHLAERAEDVGAKYNRSALTYDNAAFPRTPTIILVALPVLAKSGRLGEGPFQMFVQNFLIVGTSGIIVAGVAVWLVWLRQQTR
jgi:hypothetical protein